MRILHYFLGFHRQGGLNRYASDLALAQSTAGDEVFVLYPTGSWRLPAKAHIRAAGKCQNVGCFALTGGPAVPLLAGIRSPEMILDCPRRLSLEEMEAFWHKVMPDVVHIHTWMGFPPELFAFIRQSGAKIVYTTHDYFGLCPKVNRLLPDGSICREFSDEACSRCNHDAPPERLLCLRNWAFLLRFREILLPLKRWIGKCAVPPDPLAALAEIKPFNTLRRRYIDWWQKCDLIHFNSPVTEKIFRDAIPAAKGVVLPITHRGIRDRRQGEIRLHTPVRLAFIGSALPYKGLPMLLEALQRLEKQGVENWQLNVYGCCGKNQKRIIYYGVYRQEEEWHFLSHNDLLIAPSICDETFGFVVAEALCCGVPVIASQKMGAKILLPAEWIFAGVDELTVKLKEILSDPEVLLQRKRELRKERRFILMDEHVSAVRKLYSTTL